MTGTGHIGLRAAAGIANRAATFEPMANDDERPTITVAGVHVAVHVDPASQVRVSIDLDDAEPWLLRDDKDRTVSLRICVQGDVAFDG